MRIELAKETGSVLLNGGASVLLTDPWQLSIYFSREYIGSFWL